ITPGVIAARGNTEQAAKRGNPIFGVIRLHEFERLSGIELVSRANHAAALDRIAFSIVSRLHARRKRDDSARASVVRPSLRVPASRSVCLTPVAHRLAREVEFVSQLVKVAAPFEPGRQPSAGNPAGRTGGVFALDGPFSASRKRPPNRISFTNPIIAILAEDMERAAVP